MEHLKGRGESPPKPANTIVKFSGFVYTGRMLSQSYNCLGSSVLHVSLLAILDQGANGRVKADATVSVVVIETLLSAERFAMPEACRTDFLHPSAARGRTRGRRGNASRCLKAPDKLRRGVFASCSCPIGSNGHAMFVLVSDPLVETGFVAEKLVFVLAIVTTDTGNVMHPFLV